MKWLDEVNWSYGTAQFAKVLKRGAINTCSCKDVFAARFVDGWIRGLVADTRDRCDGATTITVS